MTEHTSIHVRRADHVGFAVAFLDETLRFWVDGLGAQLVRTGEMGGEFLGQVTGAHGAKVRMAIVALADQTIELLEYQGPDRPSVPAKPFDPASRIWLLWSMTSTRFWCGSPPTAGRRKAFRRRSRAVRGLERG